MRKSHSAVGHRQRLRARIIANGARSLADYEVLEALLFLAQPRGDTKPLAKSLLKTFGSLSRVFSASKEELHRAAVVGGSTIGDSTVTTLALIHELCLRFAWEDVSDRDVFSNWEAVKRYCSLLLRHQPVECLFVIFLDNRNALICSEELWRGTINATPLYHREIIKRALELGAASLVLAHNHPSGHAEPSVVDIQETRELSSVAEGMGIKVHDHLIIGTRDCVSLKSLGVF